MNCKFGSFFLRLFLAGVMLSGPGGGVQRCAAGTGFPIVVTNGTTFSIGVFEVVVDPNFAFLFAPAPTFFSYYPGYAGPGSGILTSPVMFDSATMIGESVSHVRNSISPTYFPVAAGTGVANYPPPNSSYSNILSYADYAFVPPVFTNGMNGVDEILTEIEQLNLQGYVAAGNGTGSNSVGCSDPRVPSTPLSAVSVKAGPGAFGIGAGLPLNRRSIGMVQQITNGAASDFPAQSFFDIFVEVSLPRVPGTVANTAFPASGAVLYNDAGNPLLIEKLSLTNLPPEATYVHGNTTAVPIRFRDNNPPYWSAGDVLGYLTLAGHGVFTNVVTASLPCAAATATGGLLDQIFGPVGSPMPPPPVPWLRPTNTFPTTNASYSSVLNTFVDSGITNVLDDTVNFTLGSTVYSIRDISLGGFTNFIAPPSPHGTATFTATSVPLKFQLSVSSTPGNWFPASGTGSLTMTISNTASTPVTNYGLQLTAFNSRSTWIGGPLFLRQSSTKQTLGNHTIARDPRGYRVSSFFDGFLQLSTDNVNFLNANRSIRLSASMPPAVPGSIFVSQIGNKAVLQWQNNFTLQSTTNLLAPFADVTGSVTNGPYTNVISGNARFFRLRN